jgi:amidase
VLRDLFREGLAFQAVNQVVLEQIATLGQRGAIIADDLTTGSDLISLFPSLRVNRYELKLALDGYFARRSPGSPVGNLQGLIVAGRHLKSLDSQLREAVKVDHLDSNREYLSRLALQRRVRQQLVDVMERHGVEALVYPFKSLGAPPIGTSDGGIRDNPVSSTTGLPAIVVPAGVDEQGLPVAIEFLGTPFSEPALIRIARAFEAASRKRLLPPTTPHLAGEVFSY